MEEFLKHACADGSLQDLGKEISSSENPKTRDNNQNTPAFNDNKIINAYLLVLELALKYTRIEYIDWLKMKYKLNFQYRTTIQ